MRLIDKLKATQKKNTSFTAQNAVSLWTGANSATVHSFGTQREPSRPVGTAAEAVERVVRFVVRSTTDWCRQDAERSRTGVHKRVSPPEKASRGGRSSARRSYPAGRCARRANPLGRRRR